MFIIEKKNVKTFNLIFLVSLSILRSQPASGSQLPNQKKNTWTIFLLFLVRKERKQRCEKNKKKSAKNYWVIQKFLLLRKIHPLNQIERFAFSHFHTQNVFYWPKVTYIHKYNLNLKNSFTTNTIYAVILVLLTFSIFFYNIYIVV